MHNPLTQHASQRRRTRLTAIAIAGALGTLVLLPSAVRAQCTGDCDNNGAVAVNELVRGVNILLEVSQLSVCPSFDVNDDGAVLVNELVQGVNNLLSECPPVGPSPTPTPPGVTNTPTPTGTPTPTCPMTAGACGTGIVDFEMGETCDDCNTEEGPGDVCPADCMIADCTGAGTRLDADVSFTAPTGVDLAVVQVFLRYPDGVVRIPGRENQSMVIDRFSNQPDNVSFDYNEQDYSVAILATTTGNAIPAGRLFTVSFDNCEGATAPTVDDFECTVVDAASTEGMSVAGVTCDLTLP